MAHDGSWEGVFFQPCGGAVVCHVSVVVLVIPCLSLSAISSFWSVMGPCRGCPIGGRWEKGLA